MKGLKVTSRSSLDCCAETQGRHITWPIVAPRCQELVCPHFTIFRPPHLTPAPQPTTPPPPCLALSKGNKSFRGQRGFRSARFWSWQYMLAYWSPAVRTASSFCVTQCSVIPSMRHTSQNDLLTSLQANTLRFSEFSDFPSHGTYLASKSY